MHTACERSLTLPMRAPNSVVNAVGDINRTLLGSLGNEDEAKKCVQPVSKSQITENEPSLCSKLSCGVEIILQREKDLKNHMFLSYTIL